MGEVSLRAILTDAIRYWERRRIAYNIVLAAIVMMGFAVAWAEGQADPYLLFAALLACLISSRLFLPLGVLLDYMQG